MFFEFTNAISNEYEVASVEKVTILEPERSNVELDCEYFYEWSKRTRNSFLNERRRKHLVAVTYGDEGSVHILQTIQEGLKRMQHIEDIGCFVTCTVLVCYENAEQAIRDVYGSNIPKQGLQVTDAVTLFEASKKNILTPKMIESNKNFEKL